MRTKLIALSLIIGLALVGAVSAGAGDFEIYHTNGNQLMILEKDTGNLNVSGKIAEQGTFLENIYCALTGCTFTGSVEAPTIKATSVLNASGAVIDFDDNSIEESDINFDTVCGAGSSLYIDSGNLACQVNTDTNTQWDISTSVYLYNNSGILDVNEATLNATIDARAITTETDPVWTAASGNYNTKTEDAATYVNRSDWTTHDDYPTGCAAGQAVQVVGDTLTCITIADEITDVWVNETGDTMTGDLIMQGNVELDPGYNITSTASTSTISILANGAVRITLDP